MAWGPIILNGAEANDAIFSGRACRRALLAGRAATA
jgi:hypothetical protein